MGYIQRFGMAVFGLFTFGVVWWLAVLPTQTSTTQHDRAAAEAIGKLHEAILELNQTAVELGRTSDSQKTDTSVLDKFTASLVKTSSGEGPIQ